MIDIPEAIEFLNCIGYKAQKSDRPGTITVRCKSGLVQDVQVPHIEPFVIRALSRSEHILDKLGEFLYPDTLPEIRNARLILKFDSAEQSIEHALRLGLTPAHLATTEDPA